MYLYGTDVHQNLIDAGCNEKTIERFLACTTMEERLQILNVQRKQLLEDYRSDAKSWIVWTISQLN